MNDSRRMCPRQRVRNLDGILKRFTHPKPLPADQLIERFARHVLHRNEGNSVRIGDVVNVHNVGVIESRSGLCLLHKTTAAFFIGELFSRKGL